ncbi:hypothetical protein KP509_15G059400 [Ceratopteris richardii]|uniref:Filament-like plant protein n=1 Tax=Ceratopteris richardii TaxID=49495 RepID=A0A8T2T8Q5_CERRI|nr:hypothetical protein KP509_15G059400 [Ceratopteris richardii]
MERRSWSWKKKVLEKLASSKTSSSPVQTSVDCSQHSVEDLESIQFEPKEQIGLAKDSSHVDVKLRILSEQLIARDELAQQHAKVAEEAVTGWEKAEYEAASLKQQLDDLLLYKDAVEKHVVQYQRSLKDNAIKLQEAEERELKLQKLVETKNQELEMLHTELESTMLKVVAERARANKETDARSQAEERENLLQNRLNVAEMEQARLKNELSILEEELDKRSEELERSKQVVEDANKQHSENAKKAAKLEDDCQRLMLLCQSRNFGSGITTQTWAKAESPCPSILDRSSVVKTVSCRFSELYKEPPPAPLWEFENHIAALKEENRSLKEALAKKDRELQTSRFLCAKKVSKLSTTQEQLDKVMHPRLHGTFHRSTKSSMDGYSNTVLDQMFLLDENSEGDSAESWASALIKELAHIRNDKRDGLVHRNFQVQPADLMDDFVEMEKLASLPLSNLEMYSGGGTVQELQSKLNAVENELNVVKVENMATRAALTSIESHLVNILQAQMEERASSIDIFEEVRAALDSMYKHVTDSSGSSFVSYQGMDSPEVRDATAWSPMDQLSCQSEDTSTFKQESKPSLKKVNLGQKLRTVVHQLVSLFEDRSQTYSNKDNFFEACDMQAWVHTDKLWKTSELECCVKSLILLCNEVLAERVDINDFVEEIASALEWLVDHVFICPEKVSTAQRRLEFGGVAEHELPSEKASLSDLHRNDHDSTNIQKQLDQLRKEKDIIDMKLNTMTKELEVSKSVLQSVEHMNKSLNLVAARDGNENSNNFKMWQDGSMRKLPSYPSILLQKSSGDIQTHTFLNGVQPSLTHLAPSLWQKAPNIMVLDTNCLSRPANEGAKKACEVCYKQDSFLKVCKYGSIVNELSSSFFDYKKEKGATL